MAMRRRGTFGLTAGLTGWLLIAALLIAAVARADGPAKGGLELRKWTSQGAAATGRPIPREAVRVFLYEGTPRSVRVNDQQIAVDYGRSGVLFNRQSGELMRRFTVADGWPGRRPEAFAAHVEPRKRPQMVGPGVVNVYRGYRPSREQQELPPEVACTVEFAGRRWRALQPANFLRSVKRPDFLRTGRKYSPSTGQRFVTWSGILTRLNEASYVEADPGGGAKPKRFTMAHGLAGNIVTRLVAHGDSLWAACVDIYDPEAKKWGPGGLCRYDRKTGRWQRINHIGGRPVRWVTLLQPVGDELWAGFREGEGVAGEKVVFGMGLYPGIYRPKTTAVVLARRTDGKWTSFSRKPRPEGSGRHPSLPTPRQVTPPTEFPEELARTGDKVMLFSRANAYQLSGNWNVPLAGFVSLLDLKTKTWRSFDLVKDLDADQLMAIVAEKGEVLVSSNRGLHRFDANSDSWRFLDPKCDLRNRVFHTAAVAGDELWLGYGRQSFGVMGTQGISRFNERTGKWSYMSPAQLGTASPVRRIVRLTNGEVWVLFGQRPYMGAAMRFLYYPRERIARPASLGRFADAKWQFPVQGPGELGKPTHFFGRADDLAAVGNKLVYATPSAVYAGPKPWKKIVDGAVIVIASTKDGKAVELVRRAPKPTDNGKTRYQRALYTPTGGELRWEEYKFPQEPDYYRFIPGDSLVTPIRTAGQTWTQIPIDNHGKWGVRKCGGCQSILETPQAVWFVSWGEMVRLDRKILADWIRRRADEN